jgi:hypothetical protein
MMSGTKTWTHTLSAVSLLQVGPHPERPAQPAANPAQAASAALHLGSMLASRRCNNELQVAQPPSSMWSVTS